MRKESFEGYTYEGWAIKEEDFPRIPEGRQILMHHSPIMKNKDGTSCNKVRITIEEIE